MKRVREEKKLTKQSEITVFLPLGKFSKDDFLSLCSVGAITKLVVCDQFLLQDRQEHFERISLFISHPAITVKFQFLTIVTFNYVSNTVKSFDTNLSVYPRYSANCLGPR